MSTFMLTLFCQPRSVLFESSRVTPITRLYSGLTEVVQGVLTLSVLFLGDVCCCVQQMLLGRWGISLNKLARSNCSLNPPSLMRVEWFSYSLICIHPHSDTVSNLPSSSEVSLLVIPQKAWLFLSEWLEIWSQYFLVCSLSTLVKIS